MNKNANTWNEGNGTVRTVFRTLALWKYSTPETCKLQLLNAVEKENVLPGPYLLQYVIKRRVREIRWLSVYAPMVAFLIISLFIISSILSFPDGHHLYMGFGLLAGLGIAFRVTFYEQYLEAQKFLSFAGDTIRREIFQKEHSTDVPPAQEQAPVAVTSGSDMVIEADLTPIEAPAITMEIKNPVIMEDVLLDKEEPLSLVTEPESDEGVPGSSHKGTINLILLEELIKKECGRPNIYNGDIHNTIAFYARITGCNPKNIADKTKYYRTREAIRLETSNARSTHRKYLELLLTHYREISDDTLYNGAEDLQSFIERQAIRKK